MAGGGLKAYNERYRRARALIEASGVSLPRGDIDLIARQLARYMPYLEDEGVDIREVVNYVVDNYDQSLSRGEKKALVQDAIEKFAKIEGEPLEDRAVLLQTKSDLERGLEELREMYENSASVEEKADIIDNMLNILDDLREINEKLLDVERLELEREMRLKMRRAARRNKAKVVERKVIIYKGDGKREVKEVKERKEEREAPKEQRVDVYELLQRMPQIRYYRPRRHYRPSRLGRIMVELTSTLITGAIVLTVMIGGLTLFIRLVVP